MTVIGISLRKIEAKVEEIDKLPANISVNSIPVIKSVKERDVEVMGLKKALVIGFEFNTDYEPKIGSIKMEGDVLYHSADQKKVEDSWKKEKKLPEDAAVEILNSIFRRCLLKVMNLAEDLQLPPPLRFPSVVKGAQEKKKKD